MIEISVAGKYLVHIEWMRPYHNPLGQQFGVSINGTVVETVKVTADELNFYSHIREVIAELPVGNSTLSLQQIGAPIATGGILVNNVKLQELVPFEDPSFDKLTG